MSVRVVCGNCGSVLVESAQAYPNELGSCGSCGSPLKQVTIDVVDTCEIREEIDGTASNKQGDVVAERISRTDGNTKSDLAADLGQPATIISVRPRRVKGFDEEGFVAEALATARNAKRRTRYTVQEKKKEDSDYADRVLASETDEPKTIDVQIRHFDTELIAQLNKTQKFEGIRASADLSEGISKAINSKAAVDAVTKSRAILLLQIPSAIGKIARQQLQRMAFDLMGFKEVWVCPFREECFEIFPPIPEHQIALTAYYHWEKAGRPWNDAQRHWFSAIDQIRAC